jgi:hypothetical protein
VPGWHEATNALQQDGKLQMVGIVSEQHGERARLFMQWKEMDWPVMVDALNVLDVPYVPITLCIDERGAIRKIVPPFAGADNIVNEFLAADYPAAGDGATKAQRVSAPAKPARLEPVAGAPAAQWRDYGDLVFFWGDEQLDRAIAAYNKVIEANPEDAETLFRLGVTYRKRYDSATRQPGDFQQAAVYWSRALNADPNNYIYRRRIQQYGPRLDKPYPFYDWINTARNDIAARGETPIVLSLEPGGAELAKPGPFEEAAAGTEPDPEHKITADGRLIAIESVVVPGSVAPGNAARVHVEFMPDATHGAHWNNEVDDVVLWITPPDGWQVNGRRLSVPSAHGTAVSQETRRIEFEIRSPDSASGRVEIPAYALYYVCEGASGACLYRRQDLRVVVHVAE